MSQSNRHSEPMISPSAEERLKVIRRQFADGHFDIHRQTAGIHVREKNDTMDFLLTLLDTLSRELEKDKQAFALLAEQAAALLKSNEALIKAREGLRKELDKQLERHADVIAGNIEQRKQIETLTAAHARLRDTLHYWLKRVRLSELSDHEREQFTRDSNLSVPSVLSVPSSTVQVPLGAGTEAEGHEHTGGKG